jgi:hypothetical protein
MDKIEARLQEWSDLAVHGVPSPVIFADPDYDVYCRAFRLKRFHRCPRCDEKRLAWTLDWLRFGRYIGCKACHWALFVWDTIEGEPDERILDIVRGVPRAAGAPR